jgi:hypothetical protein
MPDKPTTAPSFTVRRKWSIAFTVFLYTAAMLALVVMLNYLGGRHFLRFSLSDQGNDRLSPRTLHLLNSLTNQVKIILYYDKRDSLYPSVAALAGEYKLAGRNITVQTVDYVRDFATAQTVKATYKLARLVDKDLVIFDCNGRAKQIEAGALVDAVYEQVPNEKGEREFRKVPKDFKGELLFNSALLSVTNPKRLLACFLSGNGEHPPDSADENNGYQKFATLLEQNNIERRKLSLTGTNQIPQDCNLLVIAGPTDPMPQPEVDQIEQYLNEGGRLFALFNNYYPNRKIGLEKVLANWGVRVGNNEVVDERNTTSAGKDLMTSGFGEHPMLNSLRDSRLQMILPRSISKSQGKQNADAPKVDELVFTSEYGVARETDGSVIGPGAIPLMAAVEKGNVKGVLTQRGLTRIIVAGDSLFLNNHMIVAVANQDFADCAINWLLDQTELMQGVGPRPMTEYRISMTRSQMQSVRWLLLAGMPGVILLLGGLVWLRRRY